MLSIFAQQYTDVLKNYYTILEDFLDSMRAPHSEQHDVSHPEFSDILSIKDFQKYLSTTTYVEVSLLAESSWRSQNLIFKAGVDTICKQNCNGETGSYTLLYHLLTL